MKCHLMYKKLMVKGFVFTSRYLQDINREIPCQKDVSLKKAYKKG